MFKKSNIFLQKNPKSLSNVFDLNAKMAPKIENYIRPKLLFPPLIAVFKYIFDVQKITLIFEKI